MDLSKLDLNELKQLQKDVAKAIDQFEVQKRKEALAQIQQIASEAGYSLNDLVAGKAAKAAPKAPAKYAHPEDKSLTWSGRGRQPVWFKELVEGGTSVDDLLI